MEIQGWCDFGELYLRFAQRMNPGYVVVEVGAWLGKSTRFMASALRQRKIAGQFFVVDTWKGSPNEEHHRRAVQEAGGDLFWAFFGNMRQEGLLPWLIPLRMESLQAAELFQEGSVDFCFIDASHDEEAVRADIRAWKGKVKAGGTLAGHDYGGSAYPGVKRAVDAELGAVKEDGMCWLWEK